MGLSLGGWVAVDFAIAYPERVTSLIAADAAIMGYEWKEGRPSVQPAEVAQSQGIEQAKQFWMGSPLFEAARRHPRVLRRLDEMVSDGRVPLQLEDADGFPRQTTLDGRHRRPGPTP